VFNDPFFRQFDPGEIRKVPAASLGSGFIVHSEGYIVTNNHVVDRARQITVELLDGRKLQAELISADADADLAILKVASDKPLPSLELGDSSDLLIGEPVVAVGNPLGFSHTVSTGIVSANHRDLKNEGGEVTLSDLIQTDTAINRGNSGGPLLNAYGQVIGINTAIRSDAQNIGFAISVNKLRDSIPQLMNPTPVCKLDIPLKLKEKRTLAPPASVSTVVCRADDERAVVSIAGRKPRDIIDAYAILLAQKQDATFEVELADGTTENVSPTATPLPDAIVQARQRLGVVVQPLTPMVAQKYSLEVEDGMFVEEVVRDSIASKAGVLPGDILISLGRYRIGSLKDFSALLEHLPKTGRVRVGVVRDGQIGYGMLQF
ncbi:MAG: S1C family serine protease, partial [Tepidisphaeraceae bacterium]